MSWFVLAAVILCVLYRWWAPPSAPQFVRNSLSRLGSWWTDPWRPASKLAAQLATTASCWNRSQQQLVWWARPSATCCNTSATMPAAGSPSDAMTKPQTRLWMWLKIFSLPWVMRVSGSSCSDRNELIPTDTCLEFTCSAMFWICSGTRYYLKMVLKKSMFKAQVVVFQWIFLSESNSWGVVVDISSKAYTEFSVWS